MASRSASPNPSRPSIHSTRTTEATGRHSSSDPNLSGSSEDFRHRRGRDAVCSTLRKLSSSSSKGAKRFMSPTISAASKAVAVAAAPSPRRKILGERNEDAELLPSLHSPAMDAVVLKKPDAPASKESSGRELRQGPELGFGFEDGPCCCCCGCGECGEHMEEEDAEIKNHQYGALRTFRISPAANVPFGADRHLPPYDPDTNYLSPRPRFLHYRPNPRIEQYLHGESEFLVMEDGRRLDDSFSDVSCEDSSACAGEVESSGLGEECEEEESSMGFFSRSPSSVAPSLGDTGEGLVCRPAAEAGGNVQASTGLKFAPFLLVLILVCLMPFFFWNAPAISSASSSLTKAPVLQVIDDLRIRDYLGVSASNLKELIYKMKQFSSNTFGRHSTAATLPEIGAFYMDNFTVAATESSDQKRPGVDISHICLQEDRSGEDEMKAVNEAEVSGVAFEVVGNMKKAEATKGPEEQIEVENDTLKVEKIQDLGGEANRNDSSPGSPSPEAESFHTEGSLLEHGSEQMLQEEDGGSAESKDKTFENEIVEFGEQDLLPDVSTKNEATLPPQIQLSDSGDFYPEPISKPFDLQELSTHASDAASWSKLALGVSSTFILIAAGAAASVFLPRKQKQQSQAVGEVPSSANLDPEYTAQRSKNYEVDSSDSAYHIPMDPYESSTNLMESSSIGPRRTTKGGHGDQEEQDVSLSLERRRRTRRDSTGLSSSTSYGSFTTYEKVSAKKGAKAKYNEAMTPVRRSSRIKNHQVAS